MIEIDEIRQMVFTHLEEHFNFFFFLCVWILISFYLWQLYNQIVMARDIKRYWSSALSTFVIFHHKYKLFKINIQIFKDAFIQNLRDTKQII